MKISVLTVCWNSAATIRHTVDSFFAQDHDAKELVVVDGGSSDETLAIVRSYPQDRIQLISEPDSGMYDALNKGLRLYTGDAVGVLNSDDCFHDHTVLRRISASLEQADIVHGDLDFVEDHLNKRVVRRWRAVRRPAKGFRTGWMPAHPTFYVRRKVAEAVGAFDLDLKVASDYDWMLRAVELHGFESVTTNHILVDMMVGGASTRSLGSYIGHNLEALRSRRQWLSAGPIDYALVAKPVRKLGQFLSKMHRSNGPLA
ncbi:glycosyltransferase [Mesorhizobium sp. YC-39]|uniref:glycosyltransferase family 2 protein n=1 Tax=unclassified Mesorhizobium TaxID=325217 RepID=UPI0021E90FB4|nr:MULTISPECIES: glycosyltransferase family 2 protein [unclassified Mesorhizobium]MCV3210556.1 glycosyltransferase [Mesorhizobium sp. YC-2]MCV3232546.1 glycosyltransferase [Mesorhizobium sp. YC-39]